MPPPLPDPLTQKTAMLATDLDTLLARAAAGDYIPPAEISALPAGDRDRVIDAIYAYNRQQAEARRWAEPARYRLADGTVRPFQGIRA